MNTLSKVVLFTMVAGLVACSEDSTAPQPMIEPSSSSSVEGSMADLASTDTIRFSIRIDPTRNTTFYLGAGNSLFFPQGSLCSLSSSYGMSEWDKPCTKATSAVTVNVKAWLDRFGHARVDFDKHIRFVPSNDQSKWVVITFADMKAALDPFFNILYCPGITNASTGCFDESKSDPTLLTVRNPLTGKITRRIKHFSGYNVAAGRESEGAGYYNLNPSFSLSAGDMQLDTVDDIMGAYPRLSRDEAESMLGRVRETKRSGYILASG